MNRELARREGESAEEYQYRVSLHKELFGTWAAVAEYLNRQLGWHYTEAKYRKDFVLAQKMYGIVHRMGGCADGEQAELDSARRELQKEGMRTADQRRELAKLLRQDARYEHLLDRLGDAAKALRERPALLFGKTERECGEAEAVLVFADWHYGMTADNLYNRYDTRICRKRVREVVDKAAARLRRHSCKKLHILLLGDMAHGAIHTGARVASEELVCDQIMQVSEILAEAIGHLANYVQRTEVHTTYGNHLRTVPNKQDGIHSDNLERLIGWWLAERLGERNDIAVHTSPYKEYIRLHVCGWHIVATHGDLDKLRSIGVTANTLFTQLYGEPVDITLSADKHHMESFEGFGIDNAIVPALCGSDDYANGLRLYSAPAQRMMVFYPGVGCDAVYSLRASAGVKAVRRGDAA